MTDDRLAIPIDLLEDFAARLGSIVRRLDNTKATFRAFEEDMGDASVVDALDHFEHNWKDGRGDIHKQLDGLEKMANTVVQEMRKVATDPCRRVGDEWRLRPAAGNPPPGVGAVTRRTGPPAWTVFWPSFAPRPQRYIIPRNEGLIHVIRSRCHAAGKRPSRTAGRPVPGAYAW